MDCSSRHSPCGIVEDCSPGHNLVLSGLSWFTETKATRVICEELPWEQLSQKHCISIGPVSPAPRLSSLQTSTARKAARMASPLDMPRTFSMAFAENLRPSSKSYGWMTKPNQILISERTVFFQPKGRTPRIAGVNHGHWMPARSSLIGPPLLSNLGHLILPARSYEA